MRWLLVLALALGCKKKSEEPKATPIEQLSPAETQRSKDACKAYVEQVCACAEKVAAVKAQCDRAPALPEAIRINLEVAASPDSKPDVVKRVLEGVRETAKECIEQTAKLPTLGC